MTKVGSGLDSSCGFALLCKGRFPFSENFWTFRSEVKRKGQFRFIPTGIYTLFRNGRHLDILLFLFELALDASFLI